MRPLLAPGGGELLGYLADPLADTQASYRTARPAESLFGLGQPHGLPGGRGAGSGRRWAEQDGEGDGSSGESEDECNAPIKRPRREGENADGAVAVAAAAAAAAARHAAAAPRLRAAHAAVKRLAAELAAPGGAGRCIWRTAPAGSPPTAEEAGEAGPESPLVDLVSWGAAAGHLRPRVRCVALLRPPQSAGADGADGAAAAPDAAASSRPEAVTAPIPAAAAAMRAARAALAGPAFGGLLHNCSDRDALIEIACCAPSGPAASAVSARGSKGGSDGSGPPAAARFILPPGAAVAMSHLRGGTGAYDPPADAPAGPSGDAETPPVAAPASAPDRRGSSGQPPAHLLALLRAEPAEPGFDPNRGGPYGLIVLDPPWENASAARAGAYSALPARRLLGLPLDRLAAPGALVALWVTHRERLRRCIEAELLPAWGLRLEATWHWLKISDGGGLAIAGGGRPRAAADGAAAEHGVGGDETEDAGADSGGRRSYETLLLCRRHGHADGAPGASDTAGAAAPCCFRPAPDGFVLAAPPGAHSRKPPLGRLLLPFAPAGTAPRGPPPYDEWDAAVNGDGSRSRDAGCRCEFGHRVHHDQMRDPPQIHRGRPSGCLELFARCAAAGWVSWGDQALAFQQSHARLFAPAAGDR